jgi:hypothetical protein
VVSTAVFWAIPAWVTTYNDIYLFVRRYSDGHEGEDPDPDTLRAIFEELALKERFGLHEAKAEYMLKLPFYFIEQFMEKGLELAAVLDQRVLQLRNDL